MVAKAAATRVAAAAAGGDGNEAARAARAAAARAARAADAESMSRAVADRRWRVVGDAHGSGGGGGGAAAQNAVIKSAAALAAAELSVETLTERWYPRGVDGPSGPRMDDGDGMGGVELALAPRRSPSKRAAGEDNFGP